MILLLFFYHCLFIYLFFDTIKTHIFVIFQGGNTTNLALSLESGMKQEDDNILLNLSVDGGIPQEGMYPNYSQLCGTVKTGVFCQV